MKYEKDLFIDFKNHCRLNISHKQPHYAVYRDARSTTWGLLEQIDMLIITLADKRIYSRYNGCANGDYINEITQYLLIQQDYS